jgi:hypothetical protein
MNHDPALRALSDLPDYLSSGMMLAKMNSNQYCNQ